MSSALQSQSDRSSRHNISRDLLDGAQPFSKMQSDNDRLLTFSFSSNRQDTLSSLSVPYFSSGEIPNQPYSQYQSIGHDVHTVNNAAGPDATASFAASTELASHYGIPQFLPPVPSTAPNSHRPPSPANTYSQFLSLKSNYLSMLSNDPDNTVAPASTVTPAQLTSPLLSDEHGSPEEAVMQEFLTGLGDSISPSLSCSDDANIGAAHTASPEFRDANGFDGVNQYITSPLNTPYETPYDDFATSPNDDSPFNDFLTTPVIQDDSDPVILGDSGDASLQQPLFGGYVAAQTKSETPALPDMEKLYTISPSTPFLDDSSMASPKMHTAMALPPRRKSGATGTRKNITPDSLIPLDAPTQSRRYVLPSATSRKDVPAVFARKRTRAQAFDEEEDELEKQEPLAPNASERDRIEWKRRQNTLAARKSRKRKLEHQLYLETRVESLEQQVEMWKTRAETLQSTLINHGIPVAEFPENQ